MDVTGILLLLLGLAAGCALGLLLAQSRGTGAAAMQARDDRLLELADSRFREAGTRATGELDQRRAAVEHLVAPLRDTLGRVQANLRELERSRVAAYASLTEQVGLRPPELRAAANADRLAGRPRCARRRPAGRWGEMQLRRVVEVAGHGRALRLRRAGQRGHRRRRPAPRPGGAAGRRQADRGRRQGVPRRLPGGRRERDDERRAPPGSTPTRGTCASTSTGWPPRNTGARSPPRPEFVVLFVPGEAFLAPRWSTTPPCSRTRCARGWSSPPPRR